jgi:DNA-directed RNA polymerase specialized sigma24 family protein
VETNSAAGGGDLQHPWVDDDDNADDDRPTVEPGLCEVSDAEVIANVPSDARDEVERLAERVRRRGADKELFDAVLAAEFCGPRWRAMGDDLLRYGLAVVDAWLRTGYIFAKSKQVSRQLGPSDLELRQLRSDKDLRVELCGEVVALALNQFREQSIAGTGWRHDGGANLTTFFVGGCVLLFNNEFRRWRTSERRWRVNKSTDPADFVEHGEHFAEVDRGPHLFDDPARSAAGDDYLRRVLGELEETDRVIVELSDEGYSQREIGEVLDMTDRAVEGRLYRLRNKDIRSRLEGRNDG